MTDSKGLFISFEGIDGSGKSTQARLLAERLRAKGREVVLTREPGGSPGAEEIRALVLQGDPDRWSAETELLLFTAARRDHLERTIAPALARGATVICDRFADSTRMYQGLSRGDLRAVVDQLHELMIGVEPDLTLLIDMEPRAALTRAKARATAEERFEDFGLDLQVRMREGFLSLAREFPDLHIQTHLSENLAEIEFACSLYPKAKDYTDIYAHYGLLRENMLLGHAIHLSERERDALSETGAVAVHCPTSNLFLGSGLFPLKEFERRDRPVRIAVATDIGGGTSYSMLKTMDEAYKIQQLRGERLTPLESFFHMTRGNAEALGLADRIGTLEPGTDADIVVLDARATPAMALKMEAASTLAEELFLLQTLGDDRAIAETYIAGRPAKSAI